MSEYDPNVNQEEEPQTSYTPASFEKRTAAWMGVAYVLCMLFIITFSIFSGGKPLTGTFPLLLIPVAVAAAVVAIYRQRQGTALGGLPTTIVVVLVCAAAVVIGLWLGVPALIGALS